MSGRKGFSGRKSAKGHKGGSPRKDYFFYKAKKESYAARAVYKLEHIDKKFSLFLSGQRVLDLGCHPGSWLQYASRRIGNKGMVVGVDRTETVMFLPNVRTVTADIFDFTWQSLGEPPGSFDVVMSDMAPNTTGIKAVDQLKSSTLARRALDLALTFCKPGGRFVVKVFMGPDEPELHAAMQQHFAKVFRHKPEASRSISMETYLVGMDRKAKE